MGCEVECERGLRRKDQGDQQGESGACAYVCVHVHVCVRPLWPQALGKDPVLLPASGMLTLKARERLQAGGGNLQLSLL